MRVASPILKKVVYPLLAKSGYLRRRGGQGPAIVTYHGVMPAGYRVKDRNADWGLVKPELLRRQLKLLKNHYNVISPEQFRLWCEKEIELPPRSVLITCDDGMQNVFTELLPVLVEMKIFCLFFITQEAISNSHSMLWHEELHLMLLTAPNSVTVDFPQLGIRESATGRAEKRDLWWKLIHSFSQFEPGRRRQFLEDVRQQIGVAPAWKSEYVDDPVLGCRFLALNLKQSQALINAGMSIGAHTLSHPMLSKMGADLARIEIVQSKNLLEQALQQRVWALAYPFGDVGSIGPREMEMAKCAGYRCAFVNVGGGFGASHTLFAMQRVHVGGNMSVSEFEAHLSGLHRSLRQRFLGEDVADMECSFAASGVS